VHWHDLFQLELQALLAALERHAFLIDRFQQAGAHGSMDLNRARDHALGDVVDFIKSCKHAALRSMFWAAGFLAQISNPLRQPLKICDQIAPGTCK